MTNKDLSRQLCELAGIRPVYTIVKNIGDLDYQEHKFIYKSRFALLRANLDDFNEYYKKHNPDWKDCYAYRVNLSDIQEEYPNFESPENFVKLLFIRAYATNDITFGSSLGNFLKGNKPTKDFLKAVIDYFNYASDKNKEMVKQALQATDWRY